MYPRALASHNAQRRSNNRALIVQAQTGRPHDYADLTGFLF
jgi:hypothetical protein